MAHRSAFVALVFALGVACGGDTGGAEAFCEAARDLVGVDQTDQDAILAAYDRLEAEAPDEIADAITTIKNGTQDAFETGDASVAEDPDFVEASEDFDDYVEENCEPPEE